jgi:hypothetical protein
LIYANERVHIEPDRHRPIDFGSYRRNHDGHMEGLRNSGFVHADNLEFKQRPNSVTLEGEIACLGNIVVSVYKTLEVLGGQGLEATVQTVAYAYNVRIHNQHNIFRYDNLHPIKDFPDNHHKDPYDWRTGERLPSEWVGQRDWPTLADVLWEAQRWYYEHMNELDNPSGIPPVLRRS